MRLTHTLHRAVQIRAPHIATQFGERTRTWAELFERVRRLAAAFKARGVNPGDRIAILALNSDRYIEAYFASLWLGAAVVPLNTRWSGAELQFCMRDCTPVMLLFDRKFEAEAMAIRAECPPPLGYSFIDDGAAPHWCPHQDDAVASHAPMADESLGGVQLAGIFYTGGTTGFPKGVMLSHDGIMSNALATSSSMRLRPESVFLHVAPMFHLADAMMVFQVTAFGARHVILPGFDPQRVCATIEQGVSDVLLVPTMIKAVVDYCERTQTALPALEQLIYGASPIAEETLHRATRVFPRARFLQAYGQTELSPTATILEPEFHIGPGAKLRSAGRPIPGSELKIANTTGAECPRGEVGEIWVRGPNVMLGYWNQPEATAKALHGEWLRTGDAAFMDEDGFVYVVDRLKDMIISGGENVYSAEVENALAKHEAIADCAVIGVPDDSWGERVHAVLVLKPGHTIDDAALIEHCRALIAGYKCPRSLSIKSALPVSAAGKVLKAALREEFWQDASRNVH